jgi:hypothetical protein
VDLLGSLLHEAYCILSDDFLTKGNAPNGFDLAALEADLALVTA